MTKSELKTPCYIIQKDKLIKNLQILKQLREETGCKILLAQKAFSMYALYPLIGEYLDGTTASGLYEARLGKEEMGGETHVYSPAYREDEFGEILKYSDHIVFNSCAQLEKFKDRTIAMNKRVGLRINPECSTNKEHEIYDPCAPNSRLGATRSSLAHTENLPELLKDVSGLHFHTLCEQDADDLKVTLEAVEEKFGSYLKQMKWINFGGGHHITRDGYKLEVLKDCIRYMQKKYGLEVYLEPGEAIALNAGTLLCEVLEIVDNGMQIAILDTSAACHMPDVLEMPYRPPLKSAGMAGEKEYTYRLGGPTCLAGDIIGDYSFDEKLKAKSRLEFQDMAIYTMVKNNTFNGMKLPDIVLLEDGNYTVLKSFGYSDFKMRL